MLLLRLSVAGKQAPHSFVAKLGGKMPAAARRCVCLPGGRTKTVGHVQNDRNTPLRCVYATTSDTRSQEALTFCPSLPRGLPRLPGNALVNRPDQAQPFLLRFDDKHNERGRPEYRTHTPPLFCSLPPSWRLVYVFV